MWWRGLCHEEDIEVSVNGIGIAWSMGRCVMWMDGVDYERCTVFVSWRRRGDGVRRREIVKVSWRMEGAEKLRI